MRSDGGGSSRGLRLVFSLLGVCAGICAALLIGEVFLRSFFPQKLYTFEKNTFVPSRTTGYRLAANARKRHHQAEYSYTIQTNRYGFRGPEPDFGAPTRVLVLGDSYCMGQGVGEGKSMVDRTRKRLEQRGIGIFNACVAGYSGVNELGALREIAPRYHPKLVVLFFDWFDAERATSLRVQNGYLVLRPADTLQFRVREWLNSHSQVYCLVKRGVMQVRMRGQGRPGKAWIYGEKELRGAAEHIVAMRDESEKANARFTVVLLPYLGVHETPPELEKDKQSFKKLLVARKVTFFDWSEAPPPAKDRHRYQFKTDSHWTEAGNRYFGERFARLIERETSGR